MAVPEEIRVRLSRWCAERVADTERQLRQIGYTTTGDAVTIVDRRPPAFPELGAAWTSTPVAQLRGDDPEPGRWTLYRPAGAAEPDDEQAWEPDAGGPADDPMDLLPRLETAVRDSAPPTEGADG